MVSKRQHPSPQDATYANLLQIEWIKVTRPAQPPCLNRPFELTQKLILIKIPGSFGGAVRAPFAAHGYLRSAERIQWNDGTGGTEKIPGDYEGR